MHEHGWATVEEYEDDELPDNLDDEKNCLKRRHGPDESSGKSLPRARETNH